MRRRRRTMRTTPARTTTTTTVTMDMTCCLLLRDGGGIPPSGIGPGGTRRRGTTWSTRHRHLRQHLRRAPRRQRRSLPSRSAARQTSLTTTTCFYTRPLTHHRTYVSTWSRAGSSGVKAGADTNGRGHVALAGLLTSVHTGFPNSDAHGVALLAATVLPPAIGAGTTWTAPAGQGPDVLVHILIDRTSASSLGTSIALRPRASSDAQPTLLRDGRNRLGRLTCHRPMPKCAAQPAAHDLRLCCFLTPMILAIMIGLHKPSIPINPKQPDESGALGKIRVARPTTGTHPIPSARAAAIT